MGLILDTSILVAAERARFDLEALLRSQPRDETVGMATVTVSELLHGLALIPSPERRRQRTENAEAWIARFDIHPFGLEEARVHANVGVSLRSAGARIGAHDLLIAATCLHLNHRLATLNVGEFSRVPGLILVESAPFLR